MKEKRYRSSIAVVVLFSTIIGTVSLAKEELKEEKDKKSLEKTTYDLARYACLNINNLWAWQREDGHSNHSPIGLDGVYFPRGTSHVIYQDGIVWGAKAYVDAAHTIPAPFGQVVRAGGATYGTGCREGWVNGFGATAVQVSKDDPMARIFRIRRDWKEMSEEALRQDAADCWEKPLADVTAGEMQTVLDDYEWSWNNWPVNHGAPFIDRNGNGMYDPPPAGWTMADLIANGYDEPGIAGADTDSPADQVIWAVWNDLYRSLYFGSEPTGLEVQSTLWGYNRAGSLGDIFFRRVKFINKGGVEIDAGRNRGVFYLDSMYLCQWSDPDLGSAGDDLVGCDTLLSMGFAYNANDVDLSYSAFGLPPPAVGYDFLQGPVIYTGDPNDVAVFDLKYKTGFKNMGMTGFSYFSAGSPYSDPPFNNYNQGTLRWYKMLRGFAPLDGPDMRYNHPPGVTPGPYPLAGDPLTGTGHIDGLGTDYSFVPGDRRLLCISGPFALAPGDTQEVVYALVCGMGADRLSSVAVMKYNSTYAQYVYDNLFTFEPLGAIAGTVYESDGTTPIGDTRVRVFNSDWSDVGNAVTDVDGHYTYSGLSTGTYYVYADGYTLDQGSSFLGEYYNNSPDQGGAAIVNVIAPNTTQGVNFTLDVGGAISGTVYRSDGITPIANSRLMLYDADWNYLELKNTDDEGHYIFHGLSNGNYYVEATGLIERSNSAFMKEYYNNSPDRGGASQVSVTVPNITSGIDFTLLQLGAISGTVYESDGITPIYDTLMFLCNEYGDIIQSIFSYTNSQGRYLFKNLFTGSYFVLAAGSVRRQGSIYIGEYYDNSRILDDATPISVSLDETTEGIDFILNRRGWSVDLTITADGLSMTRTFGGDHSGTNGFDEGMDVISPPPGQTYYGYFEIGAFPDYLSTDIRGWVYPLGTPIDWTLKVVNASQGSTPMTTTLTWDPNRLPRDGNFTLVGASTYDMRTTNTVTFNGDRTITIQYRPVTYVTYDFPQAGWYLISLPVIPPDSSLSTLFPTALNAYHWDAVGEIYNGVTQIEPTKGYWLAIPGTASEEICGSALTNYNVHFSNQGWYMIGSVLGSVDVANPNDTPDGSVFVPVFGWNSSTIEYVQTTTLDEKNGYWAAVMGACDLTVGGGLGAGEVPKMVAKANWEAFVRQHSSTPPAPPNISWETGELVQIPTEYGLSQNYPNPFNPETTIEYQLPKDGRVTLIIYNMMGQEVRRLLDEEKRAGYYKVVWDGRSEAGIHVGTGIYLIQIKAGSFSQTRKLLLVQ